MSGSNYPATTGGEYMTTGSVKKLFTPKEVANLESGEDHSFLGISKEGTEIGMVAEKNKTEITI